MDDIAIIGGGQAGVALAAKLRQLGHDGGITLICCEDALSPISARRFRRNT